MGMAFSICLRAFTQASQEFMLLVQTSLTSPLRQTHCELLHYRHSQQCQTKPVGVEVVGVKMFMFYFLGHTESSKESKPIQITII